jgi:hypothetical protein
MILMINRTTSEHPGSIGPTDRPRAPLLLI